MTGIDKAINLKFNLIIMEQTKLKRFKRIILTSVFTIALVILTSFCIGTYQCCSASNPPKQEQIDKLPQHMGTQQLAVDTVKLRDSIEHELVSEVTKYIQTKTTNHHQFIPKYLVHSALNYDIDICFMMAQTQIETCYGTTGAGRETSRRSLFGVSIQKYDNYEEAINKYCSLIKEKYLGNKKTEQHLLTRYVTLKGGRYASNPNYERELRTAYNHIKKNTRIYNLQQEYKNMVNT